MLTQLQKLATRLQLQTPPPSVPLSANNSRRGSRRFHGNSFDNPGFFVNEIVQQNTPIDFFKNEFNASVFGPPPPPNQFLGPFIPPNYYIDPNNCEFIYIFLTIILNNLIYLTAKRTQSLMDLRTTLPGVFNTRYVHGTDDIDAVETSSKLNTNTYNTLEKKKNLDNIPMIGSVRGIDPIYCTIKDHKQKKSRQAISLENLGGIEKFQKDFNYGQNLMLNFKSNSNIGQ